MGHPSSGSAIPLVRRLVFLGRIRLRDAGDPDHYQFGRSRLTL